MPGLLKIIARLQQSNRKAYYLAVLRIAVCCWFLKEIYFRWPAFEMLYSPNSFLPVRISNTFIFFHIKAVFLQAHYLLIVYSCIVFLVLNILGVGRNIVAVLLFIALTLLYHLNKDALNGGDKMALLLVFYLCFANSFSHLTLFKQKVLPLQQERFCNLLSNLAAYGIMINLCFGYFMAALFKVNDPYWQSGTAIHYFLNDPRYSIFAKDHTIFFPKLLIYTVTYGTILFESIFPFLVWKHGRSRNIMLITGLVMHLGIYAFFMIYGMSLTYIIQYGLFFTDEEVKRFAGKLKTLLRAKNKAAV